ncbi:MAG: hypothetical protein FJW40_22110 [Acidobacteria bacterium]|nr:hypothetical protein [Acidobacteriota bacterium]
MRRAAAQREAIATAFGGEPVALLAGVPKAPGERQEKGWGFELSRSRPSGAGSPVKVGAGECGRACAR